MPIISNFPMGGNTDEIEQLIGEHNKSAEAHKEQFDKQKEYTDAARTITRTVTLTAAGWTDKAQTVTCEGVAADEAKQQIIVMPASKDESVWSADAVRCVSQGENSLNFTCSTVPTEDISVYVNITQTAYQLDVTWDTSKEYPFGDITPAEMRAKIEAASADDLSAHIADKNNPHGVTAAQIGAATAADLTAHANNKSNPHGVTPAQIGAATTTELSNAIEEVVPKTRKINNLDLSADRTLTGENIAVSTTDSTPISGAVKYRTNPNLLDNWFFGRPVNQRGDTDGDKTDWTYFIDRWLGFGHSIKYSDNGITVSIKSGASYSSIMQRYSKSLMNLVGKTVTLSCIVDNELYSATATVPSAAGTFLTVSFTSGRFEMWNASDGGDTNGVQFYFDTSHTILAAKLELGDTQTLAHKENGVWVLNEIPDYGEQLRRCQRYARAYKCLLGQTFLPLGAYRSDRKAVSFALPTSSFRAVPTVSTLNDIFQLFDGANVYPLTSLAVTDYSDGLVTIYAYTSQPFEIGKVLWVFSNTGTLLLSADL